MWRAINAVDEPFGTLYRVLLLTGARREEIAAVTWADFHEAAGTLLVPAERSKNGKPTDCAPARGCGAHHHYAEVLGPYIFTITAGERPIGAFSQRRSGSTPR